MSKIQRLSVDISICQELNDTYILRVRVDHDGQVTHYAHYVLEDHFVSLFSLLMEEAESAIKMHIKEKSESYWAPLREDESLPKVGER
jgi:hypothetical protein